MRGGLANRKLLPSKSAAKFCNLALSQKCKIKITKYGSSPTLTADFFQNPARYIAEGVSSKPKSHFRKSKLPQKSYKYQSF